MIDLKSFRKVNNLTQDDVGDYLGIKKSFISRIENNLAKLPEDKLRKLLENHYGWDTSMLIVDAAIAGDVIQANGQNNVGKMVADAEISSLKKENEMLRAQVDELKEEKEKYWEMIQRLTAR